MLCDAGSWASRRRVRLHLGVRVERRRILASLEACEARAPRPPHRSVALAQDMALVSERREDLPSALRSAPSRPSLNVALTAPTLIQPRIPAASGRLKVSTCSHKTLVNSQTVLRWPAVQIPLAVGVALFDSREHGGHVPDERDARQQDDAAPDCGGEEGREARRGFGCRDD